MEQNGTEKIITEKQNDTEYLLTTEENQEETAPTPTEPILQFTEYAPKPPLAMIYNTKLDCYTSPCTL